MKRLFVVFCCFAFLACLAYNPGPDSGQSQAAALLRSRTRGSQFPPPQPEDVTFVKTSGDDLGKVHYRSDGPIIIFLPIERYFGNATERETQHQNAMLADQFQLHMPAWDVDQNGGGSGYQPEVDKVFFNGEPLGTLSGDNQIWQMNSFSVPFEALKFPEKLGDVGLNRIEIWVDTANTGRDYWCTAIDWVALLIPAPRPLLLLHGWLSNPSTWKRLQAELRENYGVPSCTLKLGKDDAMLSNMKLIKDGLQGGAGLKKLYGVEQFNIMAHSKGGLDSRCYVNRHANADFDGDIHQVLQVATPNDGSFMAFLLYNQHMLSWHQRQLIKNAGWFEDLQSNGSWCLTPGHIRYSFAKYCPVEDTAVPVKVLAGRVPDDALGRFGRSILPLARLAYGHNDQHPDPKHWGDGVVSVHSAHKNVAPKSMSPLRGPGFDHTSIIDKRAESVLHAYLLELREVKQPKYTLAKANDSRTRSDASGGSEMREWLKEIKRQQEERQEEELHWQGAPQHAAGLLERGEQSLHQFYLQGESSPGLIFMGILPGLKISLLMPSGKRYDSENDAELFKGAQMSAEELEQTPMAELFLGMLEFSFPRPEEGACIVSLSATNTTEICNYRIILLEDEPAAALKCWLEQWQLPQGMPFRVFSQASFKQGLLSGPELDLELHVELQGEEGFVPFAPVQFRDDGVWPDEMAGDGLYSASYMPLQPGQYLFNVKAELKPLPDVKINCSHQLEAQVSASASRVLEVPEILPLDLDNNGMYDVLQARCRLHIDKKASYRLGASLLSQEGDIIAVANVDTGQAEPGELELELRFEGSKIFDSAVDGPYWVANFRLSEVDEEGAAHIGLPQDEQLKAASQQLNYIEFEHEPVMLSGKGQDRGIDLDGDGVYDRLRVSVELLLSPGLEGNYQWSGSLYDENMRILASANASGYLQSSNTMRPEAQLVFDFPVDKIIERRYSGRFLLRGISLWGGKLSEVRFLPTEYSSGHYSGRDFVSQINMLDLGSAVQLDFQDWRVQAEDGALACRMRILNHSGKENAETLELVYWLVLPSTEECRLQRIDGITAEGQQYMDITEQVEMALREKGRLDSKLEPGEAVEVDISLYCRDRSVPEAKIFSFWADPPYLSNEPNPLDLNQDHLIDDWEILLGLEKWRLGEVDDSQILDAIHCWQTQKKLGGKP